MFCRFAEASLFRGLLGLGAPPVYLGHPELLIEGGQR